MPSEQSLEIAQELRSIFMFSLLYTLVNLTLIYFGYQLISVYVLVGMLFYSVYQDVIQTPEVHPITTQKNRSLAMTGSLVVFFFILCSTAILSSEFEIETKPKTFTIGLVTRSEEIEMDLPHLVYRGFPDPVPGETYKVDFVMTKVLVQFIVDFTKFTVLRLMLSEAELVILNALDLYHSFY